MIHIGSTLDMFVFRIEQENATVKARKHTAVIVDIESGILTICTDKHRERIVPPTLFIPTHEMLKPRAWCNEEETLSLIMAYPGNMTWKGAFPLLQKSARKAIRERVRKVKDEAYMSLKIIDNGKFV